MSQRTKSYFVGLDEGVLDQVNEVLRVFRHASACAVEPENGPYAILAANLIFVNMAPGSEQMLSTLDRMVDTIGGLGQRGAVDKQIVAIGPPVGELVLDALRRGADAYVNSAQIVEDLTQFLSTRDETHSAFRSLSEPGRVIAILSASGGYGGSTIAANLACEFSKTHHAVSLFDFDQRFGILDSLLDLRPTHSLSDFCGNGETADYSRLDSVFAKHACGVHFAHAPPTFESDRTISSESVRRLFAMCRGFFPFTIIDVSRSLDDVQLEALRTADAVLLVTKLEFNGLRNCKTMLDLLMNGGVSEKCVHLVVNREGRAYEIRSRLAARLTGKKFFHSIPEQSKIVLKAERQGGPFVLRYPNTPIAKSISQLAASLSQLWDPCAAPTRSSGWASLLGWMVSKS